MKKSVILKAATLALALFLATGVAFAQEYGQEVQTKAGEYNVTFSTDPQPAAVDWNKINILIKDASGQYVRDADVTVEYKMDPMFGPEMFATPNKAKTILKGDKYQGELKLSMDGIWHLVIKIARAGKVTVLNQDLTVLSSTTTG
jgi:hypothetical protein